MHITLFDNKYVAHSAVVEDVVLSDSVTESPGYIVVDTLTQRVCQRDGQPKLFDSINDAQDYIDYLHMQYGPGEEGYEVCNAVDCSPVT